MSSSLVWINVAGEELRYLEKTTTTFWLGLHRSR